MKKLIIFFVAIIVIISGISLIYFNYKAEYNMAKRSNLKFEKYLNKEVDGMEVATAINRAIDNNQKYEIQKNNKGMYLSDNENSISIEIKMTDNDSIYQMETIYNSGIQNFINYYGNIKFKCVNIKYHSSNNKDNTEATSNNYGEVNSGIIDTNSDSSLKVDDELEKEALELLGNPEDSKDNKSLILKCIGVLSVVSLGAIAVYMKRRVKKK